MLRLFGKQAWETLPALILRVASVAIVVVVAYILVPQIVNAPTTIDDISVPQVFAERGYTATVASERLRDTIESIETEAIEATGYISRSSNFMVSADFAAAQDLERERLNILVPVVGLSTESISSLSASLLHAHRYSGEFIVLPGKRLSLTLRQDDKSFGAPLSGALTEPDSLLRMAAQEILEQRHPSVVVAALSHKATAIAIQKSDSILARLKPNDVEALRIHALRQNMLADDCDFAAAEREFKAIIAVTKSYAARIY